MSVRSERIKSLIEQSGKSYQELEKSTGIKKSSLQRYASGVTTKIPLDVIERLSVAFNVSQEYLMGWEEKKNSSDERQLTEGARQMLELFMLVPEEQQPLVLDMIRAALKKRG
jgi:transcriptional regulator with XRE-family HTH domain